MSKRKTHSSKYWCLVILNHDEKEIDYLEEESLSMKNNKKDAVFGISLGDLVGDDLSFTSAIH